MYIIYILYMHIIFVSSFQTWIFFVFFFCRYLENHLQHFILSTMSQKSKYLIFFFFVFHNLRTFIAKNNGTIATIRWMGIFSFVTTEKKIYFCLRATMTSVYYYYLSIQYQQWWWWTIARKTAVGIMETEKMTIYFHYVHL